jgi:adenine-specific DNA-methyltransferase
MIMKYMGSKKYLLNNGLGKLILEKAKKTNNFFDPFCGSSAVIWFVANKIENKIFAGDLQEYSVVLANSVLNRTSAKDFYSLKKNWLKSIQSEFIELNRNLKINNKLVGTITKAYGGYYFSFDQAIKFDLLIKHLPLQKTNRIIAKAALIIAASNCVASPGHTAQPFQPTNSGMRFIFEAWSRDPFKYVEKALEEICPIFSKKKGEARVSEANSLLSKLNEGDLVFLDPPYSGVHYSRFYHVLETIARGYCSKVEGVGRYPKPLERPKSLFSMRSKSIEALDDLLSLISRKKASAILTFPNHECSNGLSGSLVKEISQKYFNVDRAIVKNNFSTLGGNKVKRPARLDTEELILNLEPK